jgi:hypothetical protein
MDYPAFSRDSDHEFLPGEPVYIIDSNEYDIWEAYVRAIAPNRIRVRIPSEGLSEQWVQSKRILEKNEVNIAIFEEQERIRRAKELRDMEMSSGDEGSDAPVEEDSVQEWNHIEGYLPQLHFILEKCSRPRRGSE